MIDEGWLVVYIDNILIYGATKEETMEHTIRVLQHLREKDLFLKLEKCRFALPEVDFLGMIVSRGQISMDLAKVTGISKWPEPKMVKQVRSFLGFVNFYRKFVGNYAEIVAPLMELMKKNVLYQWGATHQMAFDVIKKCFTQQPVLVMPDPVKLFIVKMDTSN